MPGRITIADHNDGSLIEVWVVPGAARSEIGGPHDGAVRVRVAAAPEAGKANQAVARLLKRHLGARDVYLVRGLHSRRKQFVVVGMDPTEVAARLG